MSTTQISDRQVSFDYEDIDIKISSHNRWLMRVPDEVKGVKLLFINGIKQRKVIDYKLDILDGMKIIIFSHPNEVGDHISILARVNKISSDW